MAVYIRDGERRTKFLDEYEAMFREARQCKLDRYSGIGSIAKYSAGHDINSFWLLPEMKRSRASALMSAHLAALAAEPKVRA